MLSGIPFPPSAVFFPVHPSLGLPPPPVLLRQWFRVRRCFFYVLLFLNHLPHHTTIVRWHGLSSEIFSFVFLRVFFFFLSHAAICHSRPSVSPSSVPVLPPPPPSPLLSLCILDHFLSFQVSGPVETDYPSSRGRSAPYRLGGVSVSFCSRYAHSPNPLCVGGRGRGTGRPPAHCGRHLLQ